MRLFLFVSLSLTLLCASSCMTLVKRPCGEGGQPAHDDGKPGKGTKQCIQQKDTAGNYVNHGKYIEWFPNGNRALEGDFVGGVKEGKWTEWDDQGRKLADKWYEKGELVPGREVQPYNGLARPPRATAAEAAPAKK